MVEDGEADAAGRLVAGDLLAQDRTAAFHRHRRQTDKILGAFYAPLVLPIGRADHRTAAEAGRGYDSNC